MILNGKKSKARGCALYKKVRMDDEKQNTAAAILRALNEINESDVNDAFRRLYPRGEQSS